jgi:hypothetical protein
MAVGRDHRIQVKNVVGEVYSFYFQISNMLMDWQLTDKFDCF